jgi:hypothetical protein
MLCIWFSRINPPDEVQANSCIQARACKLVTNCFFIRPLPSSRWSRFGRSLPDPASTAHECCMVPLSPRAHPVSTGLKATGAMQLRTRLLAKRGSGNDNTSRPESDNNPDGTPKPSLQCYSHDDDQLKKNVWPNSDYSLLLAMLYTWSTTILPNTT